MLSDQAQQFLTEWQYKAQPRFKSTRTHERIISLIFRDLLGGDANAVALIGTAFS